MFLCFAVLELLCILLNRACSRCCPSKYILSDFSAIVGQVYHTFVLSVINCDIAAYVGALLINVFGALTYMIASVHNGIDNQSATTFGMSIVCAILYTPCSFVCWYRPVYKAFK